MNPRKKINGQDLSVAAFQMTLKKYENIFQVKKICSSEKSASEVP